MKIALPDTNGELHDYTLAGTPIAAAPLSGDPARVVFSAAHVVADPFAEGDPSAAAISTVWALASPKRWIRRNGVWGLTGRARWN